MSSIYTFISRMDIEADSREEAEEKFNESALEFSINASIEDIKDKENEEDE